MSLYKTHLEAEYLRDHGDIEGADALEALIAERRLTTTEGAPDDAPTDDAPTDDA